MGRRYGHLATGEPPGTRSAGAPSIGYWNSVLLMVNNVVGVGLVSLPALFQQAGWLPASCMLLVFMCLAACASVMLCEALALIPGNERFQKQIEYTGAVKWYFGHTWYLASQVGYNLCMTTFNIASIIVAAQNADTFLLFLFRKSFALQLFPAVRVVQLTDGALDALGSEFTIQITLGYLLVMAVCLPMSFLNLSENVQFQNVSFAITIVVLTELVAYFVAIPNEGAGFGALGDRYLQLIGLCIFSYSFVLTVPSWANEKQEHVRVGEVVWLASGASTAMYAIMGVLGAVALPELHSDNVLNELAGKHPAWVQISLFIFNAVSIAPGIPACSILVRYNLESGLLSPVWSMFWGAVAPWMVAHLFYSGDGFAHLLLWTSLTLNGTFNFVVPLLMYIRACTWTGASAVARKHASINSTLVRPPRGSAVPWTVDENEVMSLLPHAGGAAAMRGMTDEPDRGGACCPLDRRKRLATWLVVLYCFLLGVQAALIVLYMGLLGEGFFTRNPELASSIVIV